MKRATLLLAAALLLTGSTLLSAKGNPDSPASVPVLLGLEPVRQDLKISSLQVALLDSIRAEYKAKAGVIAAVGLSDAKFATKAAADIKELRHRYNQRALNVLNPTQQQRLRQIERQMLGGAILTSATEQKLLGITPEQSKKLADIHSHDVAKAAEINAKFNAGKISAFRRDIDLHRNLRTTSRSMLHVLTPEQTKQWLGLTGSKLKL
jgi:Spy/CpxP family protein refolding chaperone